MQEVTIAIGNFDKMRFEYITKAKDRDENSGVLIFIPTLDDKHSNKLIEDFKTYGRYMKIIGCVNKNGNGFMYCECCHFIKGKCDEYMKQFKKVYVTEN